MLAVFIILVVVGVGVSAKTPKEPAPPIKCKKNEVYNPCSTICPPQTCESIYTDYDCRDATKCEPGCDCISEYLRNGTANDPCIPSHLCPPPPPPPIKCKENEVYNPCSTICPPQTCESIYTDYDCRGATKCEPGCDCISEYLRNGTANDPCIPSHLCPPLLPPPIKCKENEVYNPCSTICPPQTCESIYTDYDCRDATKCEPGCDCISEYLRNGTANDPCIPSHLCPPLLPPPIKCKENEVYNPCSTICPPQTCESIYTDYDCRGATKCEPGCDCISEYLRNGTANDLCIPSHLCPPPRPVCGINEHYETNRNKCELTCKNYHLEPVMGPCQATSACFCDDGYVKNSNGLCIPKKKCPKHLVCPPNEVVSECYNSCLVTCKTRLRSDGRMCQLACIDTGCVCKKGYLRHDNGTCVPISQCSPPRCNDNETYSKCGTACPPTCQNRGDNSTVCTKQCVEDCFCNKGFVRTDNDDGSCIKPEDCPNNQCSDPNAERVQCALAAECRATCANPNPRPCISQICIKNECVCKKGYVLSKKGGKCIPLKQCPPPPIKCKENEVYSPCRIICPPQTCDSIRTSYNCQDAPKCEPGCDCISEYLRNGTANDPCIPSHLCPTCKNPFSRHLAAMTMKPTRSAVQPAPRLVRTEATIALPALNSASRIASATRASCALSTAAASSLKTVHLASVVLTKH